MSYHVLGAQAQELKHIRVANNVQRALLLRALVGQSGQGRFVG